MKRIANPANGAKQIDRGSPKNSGPPVALSLFVTVPLR